MAFLSLAFFPEEFITMLQLSKCTEESQYSALDLRLRMSVFLIRNTVSALCGLHFLQSFFSIFRPVNLMLI